ncbi:hypothetical protein [Streptomyces sp. ODS05-4]|uniref:hypothetical protein n=1 Tax=Streptomyces sp. ODS05-4 TaxID=2944939 RepID=UPI00210EC26B|nr:hypothetical protein [Streptomyces sp. ODS05-4]
MSLSTGPQPATGAVRLDRGPERNRDRDRELGRVTPSRRGAAGRRGGGRPRRPSPFAVRRSLAAAFVGSPAAVADRIGVLRAAGVDTVQLDMAVEREEDRELRRDLVRRLRHPYTDGRRAAW